MPPSASYYMPNMRYRSVSYLLLRYNKCFSSIAYTRYMLRYIRPLVGALAHVIFVNNCYALLLFCACCALFFVCACCGLLRPVPHATPCVKSRQQQVFVERFGFCKQRTGGTRRDKINSTTKCSFPSGMRSLWRRGWDSNSG